MAGFRLVEQRKEKAAAVRARRGEQQQQAARRAAAAQRQKDDAARRRNYFNRADPSVERPYSFAETISPELYEYQKQVYTREQVGKLTASPEYKLWQRLKFWKWLKWEIALALCILAVSMWFVFTFSQEDPED